MDDILIFKFGALGDVIMATPLIKAIINSTSGSRCTLVTTAPFVDIFKNWPQLQVEIIDLKSLCKNIRFIMHLRKKSYSRLFDLQSNDRSRIICLLSGIKNSVGNHHFPYKFHPEQPWKGQTHIFQRMREMLLSADIIVEQEVPFLPASTTQINKVENWTVNNLSKERRFALLHAGSSKLRLDKRWPYFLDLAQRLSERSVQVVWVGGADDAILNRSLSAVVGIDATGVFDVIELAELGRQAAFAVTNDSGPMHILSASGIPVFGLFGPSSKERNHAVGQRERALSVQDYNKGKIDSDGISLRDLPTDLVLDKLADSNLLP